MNKLGAVVKLRIIIIIIIQQSINNPMYRLCLLRNSCSCRASWFGASVVLHVNMIDKSAVIGPVYTTLSTTIAAALKNKQIKI